MGIVKNVADTKSVLETLVECKNLLINNWKFFLILFALVALSFTIYFLSRYYAYETPKTCIHTFYAEITKGNYDNAWSKLSDKYKSDRLGNNKDKFRKIYDTTTGFGSVTVEPTNAKGLISDIFSNDRDYIVTYEVEDVISKSDLTTDGPQMLNSFWVQVKEEQSFSELKGSSRLRFTIRRVFTQKIRVIKENNDWKISQIVTTLI